MSHFSEDLSLFFHDSDLANKVTFKSGKLKGKTVSGIFDVKFSDQGFGSMMVSTENSQFLGISEELSGVAANDVLVSDGLSYRVVAILRDKTGQAILDLAEEIEEDRT